MSTASVIGGGPAGLIAAEELARAGVAVTVYEHMPAVGRKFLLAGHGGLNITHSEDRDRLLARYGDCADRLAPMLAVFGPQDLRDWCAGLGEPTFVGSSGRVFPRAFRATPLLRAWLARLAGLGVRIETRRQWTGWADPSGALRFADADAVVASDVAGDADADVDAAVAAAVAAPVIEVASDVTLFALGGASWPRLGSDGSWVDPFRARGVSVTPLRPANVGVRVRWTDIVADRFAGTPLKNVGLTVRGHPGPPVRGDAMVTRTGLEGGPIYAVGAAIRNALDADAPCVLEVDLRPDLTADNLAQRLLHRRPKDSGSNWLRRSIGLDPVAIALVRESTGGALPREPAATAELIKAVPVVVTATMPIGRAISTAGGIAWSEVDESLMLRRLPGTFVAGEMLDWEAPTGGYLLQASFSTGVTAARGALTWLKRETWR